MKLGFIGVGKIATSVIEGIFNSKINIKEIILSPKNRQNTNSLRNKFKKIKKILYYFNNIFGHITNAIFVKINI